MNDETYATPEGFKLYRPLVMPGVTDFAELFTAEGPWSFSRMNQRNGYAQPDTPQGVEFDGLTFSRFCSVENIPGRASSMDGSGHILVTPKPELMEALRPTFGFEFPVEWEVIYHAANERCLVVASPDSAHLESLCRIHPAGDCSDVLIRV